MKTLVAALCTLTILAVVYLSFSLILLRPPRANYSAWFALATIITIQTVATLSAIAGSTVWLRVAVTAGGAALAAIGVWMARETLASPHFEGYGLLLGAMLVVQGLVTVAAFARRARARPFQSRGTPSGAS
jgi:hypothetical protein